MTPSYFTAIKMDFTWELQATPVLTMKIKIEQWPSQLSPQMTMYTTKRCKLKSKLRLSFFRLSVTILSSCIRHYGILLKNWRPKLKRKSKKLSLSLFPLLIQTKHKEMLLSAILMSGAINCQEDCMTNFKSALT